MLSDLKFQRLKETGVCAGLSTHILDYFVRREVIKKMVEEDQLLDEQIFFVPFKTKEQDIPDAVGKAMDTWTEADKAKMEAETLKEIEENFPSYFDEVQRTFYDGVFQKDKKDFEHSKFTEV